MDNIWAQSFKDIRKPFFEIEDPYTLQEKAAAEDYDKDGKIESGPDEFLGSRDKAIKNSIKSKKSTKIDGYPGKANNKVDVCPTDSKNEEVDAWILKLLDEGYDLSDYTLEDMYEIYNESKNHKNI